MYYLREILRLFHLLLSIPLTLGQQLHVENGPSSPSSSTAAAATTTTPFNISALVSRDGYSVIECWQLAASSTYALFALNWILGNTTHVKLTMAEPGEISTDAWAPAVQLVMVLNGLVRISTPHSPAPFNNMVAYFSPGTLSSSVFVATDRKELSYIAGHYTEVPGSEKTLLVQLPFAGNITPEYSVLHDGQCLS